MIIFEITESPDSNVKKQFTFYKNQVYLGKNSGDLWINDSLILQNNTLLEVINNDLLIHPQRGVEFYLINGKRASVIRKLKRMDVITIGNTSLRIIDFKKSESLNKKQVLDKKLDKLIEENSSRLTVIEEITKLMK